MNRFIFFLILICLNAIVASVCNCKFKDEDFKDCYYKKKITQYDIEKQEETKLSEEELKIIITYFLYPQEYIDIKESINNIRYAEYHKLSFFGSIYNQIENSNFKPTLLEKLHRLRAERFTYFSLLKSVELITSIGNARQIKKLVKNDDYLTIEQKQELTEIIDKKICDYFINLF
jgi:hypothetical protein